LETTDIEKFKRRGDNAIRLIAIHSAKKGLGDQLLNILVKVIEPTRKEEGNIAYVLHRSMDNPDELMFDENGSTKNLLKRISINHISLQQ
jgi:hypothetical protein